MPDEDNRDALNRDEALLNRLEQQEHVIETENHIGFGDIVRRTHVKEQIEALDTEILHLRERPIEGEG